MLACGYHTGEPINLGRACVALGKVAGLAQKAQPEGWREGFGREL